MPVLAGALGQHRRGAEDGQGCEGDCNVYPVHDRLSLIEKSLGPTRHEHDLFVETTRWAAVVTARLNVWRSHFSLIVRLISVPQLSQT